MNAYAYSSLIYAYSWNGMYREVISLFKRMEKGGCEPNVVTHNIMLYVYGKMGNSWNKVVSLFEEMKVPTIPS